MSATGILVQGDFVLRLTSGRHPLAQVVEISGDVGPRKASGLEGMKKVTALSGDVPRVDVDPGPLDRGVVHLPNVGSPAADEIDLGPWLQPRSMNGLSRELGTREADEPCQVGTTAREIRARPFARLSRDLAWAYISRPPPEHRAAGLPPEYISLVLDRLVGIISRIIG